MDALRIPDIYCPFPPALNQYAEHADRFALDWAHRFGLLGDADSELGFVRTHLGYLSGYVYPEFSAEAMRVGTAWFGWLMLYDDAWLDKRKVVDRLSANEVRAFQTRATEIMAGARAGYTDPPLLHCLEDIRKSLLRLQPDWEMEPFLRRFENYLQSNLWEATNIWDDITPRLPTYVSMRRQTGSLFATYQLGRMLGGILLDPEVRAHVALEQLEIMSNNYICWLNDVYSFEWEHSNGTVNNLVIVLQHEYDCSFQEALERAAAMCRAEVEAYVDLKLRLPRIGLPVDEELARYLRFLESWMGGLKEWTLFTRRYEVELPRPRNEVTTE